MCQWLRLRTYTTGLMDRFIKADLCRPLGTSAEFIVVEPMLRLAEFNQPVAY